MASPVCTHFEEVCKLSATTELGGSYYCILHFPDASKSVPDFQNALVAYLDNGRANFRHFVFPAGWSEPAFARHEFLTTADFRDVIVSGRLDLTGARFAAPLLLGGQQLNHIVISQATLEGPLELNTVYDGGTLDANDATFAGPVSIEAPAIHFRAREARFREVLMLRAREVRTLRLQGATISSLTMRGASATDVAITGIQLLGLLDWKDSYFAADLSFEGVTFGEAARLDLSGARMNGSLVLAGTMNVPISVTVDGLFVRAHSRLEGTFAGPRLHLVGTERPPYFEGGVLLRNVDVSRCLLVGNPIRRIELSNIAWSRRYGRHLLFDEVLRRKGSADVPLRHLREAYQILKEWYKTSGDHATSGDFHYGEMEVKRRELGFPRQWIGWEALYWALSGYGTGHVRALLGLIGLVVAFAAGYVLAEPGVSASDFRDAVYFSARVALLQEREVSARMSTAGRWLHLAESIAGPVQIALFVLALRLRLKR